ncbi:hypothetical protein HPP92_011347 [Vanilla planifolia]|uniref:Uncharacterized protein n=1 Tax=Vanilla planifolia TaxID=51239 RepID=A0A835V3E9_VANPL|nr:hypothetical protein HPP92_011347 [Vanilla planifolia]
MDSGTSFGIELRSSSGLGEPKAVAKNTFCRGSFRRLTAAACRAVRHGPPPEPDPGSTASQTRAREMIMKNEVK